MLTRAMTRRAAAGLAAALIVLSAPHAALSQVVKPWIPAGADTAVAIAADARVRFKAQTTDSLNDQTIGPYQLVGGIARKLLGSLGRENTLEAPAIEATLDSLGLDVDVVNDPLVPSIVLVLVRNPFRPGAQAVGYLYWYRGSDLRMQGASFPPCQRPKIRSWWSGRAEYPYETAVAYVRRGEKPDLGFALFRMNPDGYFWNLTQYEGSGPDLGRAGDVEFPDVNGDGLPELVSFTPVTPESLLTLVSGTPPLLNEVTYTERPEGFTLHDVRSVPGPVATLRLFALLLSDRKPEEARRLLVKPVRVAEAVANGWGTDRRAGAWTVEYGEPNTAWPRWLELRIRARGLVKRWIFHFQLTDGRWLISNWLAVTPSSPSAPGTSPAPADSAHARVR